MAGRGGPLLVPLALCARPLLPRAPHRAPPRYPHVHRGQARNLRANGPEASPVRVAERRNPGPRKPRPPQGLSALPQTAPWPQPCIGQNLGCADPIGPARPAREPGRFQSSRLGQPISVWRDQTLAGCRSRGREARSVLAILPRAERRLLCPRGGLPDRLPRRQAQYCSQGPPARPGTRPFPGDRPCSGDECSLPPHRALAFSERWPGRWRR